MTHIDVVTTILKLLADQTRLRILSVLSGSELTVKELTDILALGQSTISTQLGQLKEAQLVSFRKQGQFVFYRLYSHPADHHIPRLCTQVLDQVPLADWYERDQRRLTDCLEKRRESSIGFFASHRTQNEISPGQTWESLATGLLHLVDNKRIVDLGCGIGRLAALLAHGSNHIIGIDNSPEQIQAARNLHRRIPEEVLRFVLAPAEYTGLPQDSADLVLISQSLHHAAKPRDIVTEAARLLAPGGKLLILDLLSHNQDWIQDRFADFWLGFEPEDLHEWAKSAGLSATRHTIGAPDPLYPEIEPLVFFAQKN